MTDQNSTLTKVCTKCGSEKEATPENFYSSKRGLFGLKSACKTCESEYNRARKHAEYWSDPEAARAKSAKFRELNGEKVVRLRKESYAKRRESILVSRKARYDKNRDEISARRREKYMEDVEASRRKQRDDRLKNREARLARAREYRQRNIEKIRQQERVYGLRKFYRRYGTDLAFTLKMRTSALLRASLRAGHKSQKTEALLGYTIEDLRKHLEAGFSEGMTWEKFLAGEIHIDHIRPVSSFSIDSDSCEDFKACWALDNLQPLWAKDNISKGAKYDPS